MYTKTGVAAGVAGATAAALPNTGIGYAAWMVLAFVLLVAGFAAIRTARIKSRDTARHVS